MRTLILSFAAFIVILSTSAQANVSVDFQTEGLSYAEFLAAVTQEGPLSFNLDTDVFVDGKKVGDIPESGPVALSLQPGAHIISGAIGRVVGGSELLAVEAGQSYTLTIELSGEGLSGILQHELLANSEQSPVISGTATELRLDFAAPDDDLYSLRQGFQIYAARIDLDLQFGGPSTQLSKRLDFTGYFELDSNGRIFAPNPGVVIAALMNLGAGPYELTVNATETGQGLPLESSITIRISKYTLGGDILRLPSSPTFPLGGISVVVASTRGGVGKTVTTAPDGSFSFGTLPEDTYKVSVETAFSAEILAVEGFVSLTESTRLVLTPLSIAQAVVGEQGFVIVSGF
ncbi:MAG: carboxypeptidase-like regulatory domain-containing protein [Alphaproteobacteria bacterium]|nr:carboxypeptidase-like regulatory domain-containing protein [Alphaproteobacteria bacterium]MBU2084573.1 carboxypeptidase-like regulatory domain-containing protein [Alphaproteobacteria bacterium]MBU2142746.1 carboxypeptidase-like regulatory domain-containing protein [Alphaproteobacteria bacterium]MBU2196891.1 carboxypeptidase-like regulatory domain-containing protein [Alphaproteobacteria bacterium]